MSTLDSRQFDPDFTCDSSVAADASPSACEPWLAWRLACVYGPIARALVTVLRSSPAGKLRRSRQSSEPKPILQVGGQENILASFLQQEAIATNLAIPDCEITYISSTAGHALPQLGLFACVVAIDWLPLLSPTLRQAAITRLCRLAVSGVIVANAFEFRADFDSFTDSQPPSPHLAG